MFALVDEWGNPSPTSGNMDWFGFAALFLKDDQIEPMRELYADVCRRLPGHLFNKPIHTLNLDWNSKYHITKLITRVNPAISIIAVRIRDITTKTLRQRGWTYRFYAKEIVRSATHFAADHNEVAKIAFHRHDYYAGFDDYLRDRVQFSNKQKTASKPKQILFNKLVNMYQSDDEDELLLSFADCIAYACKLALIPDDTWHQVNPAVLNLIQDYIWRGPSYADNPRLFGIMLRPYGILPEIISQLPDAFRQYWQ